MKPRLITEMGRIDTDLMFDIIKKWEWGNAHRSDIYHDPQTRRQSISYRLNLARLIEQLIKEEKFDKAEKVIDLAFEKMPIKHFDFYGLNEPFIDGYFKIIKLYEGGFFLF